MALGIQRDPRFQLDRVGGQAIMNPTVPPRRKTVLVLISMGWLVRNFVRSGLLDMLAEHADVVVGLPTGAHEVEHELTTRRVRSVMLPTLKLRWYQNFATLVLIYAHNRRFGLWHPAMWRWIVSVERPSRRLVLQFVRLLSWITSGSVLYERCRKWLLDSVAAIPADAATQEIFDEVRPDVVLAGNPFAFQELTIAHEARRRNVPVLATIVSWDNLSYKGFPLARFTRFLVWSDLMRGELLRTDASIDPASIVVTGTPQFDFHLEERLDWGREKLFATANLDPDRPTVLYTASAHTTFPEEPELVHRLWQALENGAVPGRPQLMLRTHPHDVTDRFGHLRERGPGLVFSHPGATSTRLWFFSPSMDDIALLSNSVRYADVCVNVFSTVVLDAAVVDTPTVCVAFSYSPNSPATRYTEVCMDFGHCKYIADSGPAQIARNMTQLTSQIARYLADPSLDREHRREVVDRICGPVDGHAASRIADAVFDVLGLVQGLSAQEPRLLARQAP
jgi:hypothetical protein